MNDVIEGTVLDILDEDTIEIAIDRVLPPDREVDYLQVETIRFVDDDTGSGGSDDTTMIERLHQDARIRCQVSERDDDGLLLGSIEIIDGEDGVEEALAHHDEDANA